MKLKIDSKCDGFEITFHDGSIFEPSTYEITPQSMEECVKAVIDNHAHLASSPRRISEYVLPYSVFEIFTKLEFNVMPDGEFSEALLMIKQRHDNEGVDSRVILNPINDLSEHRECGDYKNYSIDFSEMYRVVESSIRLIPKGSTVDIEVREVKWHGPHESSEMWVFAKSVPLECNFNLEINKILNGKYFGYCRSCNRYLLRGWMHDSDLCCSCTTMHTGELF